eukprot:5969730-Prymnesium_polylepis.1
MRHLQYPEALLSTVGSEMRHRVANELARSERVRYPWVSGVIPTRAVLLLVLAHQERVTIGRAFCACSAQAASGAALRASQAWHDVAFHYPRWTIALWGITSNADNAFKCAQTHHTIA